MSEFRTDSIKDYTTEKTDDGLLIVAPVARVGILKYQLPNGKIQSELVPEDELFREDSIKTMYMKPVLADHTSKKNLKKAKTVGHVGESFEKKDGLLKYRFAVSGEESLSQIESGKNQLSCGYECTLEMTSGIWNGEKYDAIQRNRKYNHLALCYNARGGNKLSFRMDANEAIDINLMEDKALALVKINGKDYEVDKEVFDSFENQKATIAQLTEDAKKKQSDQDKLQAKCDSLESEVKAKNDSIPVLVTERVKINEFANKLQLTEKLDSFTNTKAKQVILEAKKIDCTGKSEDYINARFDAMVESFEDSTTAKQLQGGTPKKEEKTDADKKAFDDHYEEYKKKFYK